MRWILLLCLALMPMSAMASNNDSYAQGECGLTQMEYNAIVEDLYGSDTKAEVFAKLAALPIELAECIESTLTAEIDAENDRIMRDVHELETHSPAAQAVIADYGVNPDDIVSVSRIQPIDDGELLEEIDIVTVGDDRYYYFSEDERVDDEEPPSLTWTHEARQFGRYMKNVGSWWWCPSAEWVVGFEPLPTCFHEISPGRFDGIDDAWAPSPSCSDCAEWCAGKQCGAAWDGPGYNGWWNLFVCPGRDKHWSIDAGKMVQKRWFYSWRNCHNVNEADIARKVERLIHW